MNQPAAPVQAPDRVLSTLNADGSRRWIRPHPTHGAWWTKRRIVAWVLMFVFFAVPYLRMNDRPLVLLDLPRRHFTLFGTTFLPTETLLFMLLFLSVGITIFFVTAVFGRVWCGWACPQTVYMEFLFRPIEYLLEGGPGGTARLDRTPGFRLRRLAKYAIYVLLAMFLAHTFLAYFVGIDQLKHWVTTSPRLHPVAFLVMAGTTVAIFLDFAWFREQTCLVACPYGRLQTVMFDRQSLIVAYDPTRGEPRRKGVKLRPADAGDCIDCQLCVRTCPTGIDIREGLQMECVHCTQCIDACDDIMAKVGKPPGLIRYSSQAEISGRPKRLIRARVLLYPAALTITLGLFVTLLFARSTSAVTLLRGTGAPFELRADGTVLGQMRLKFENRGSAERSYRISLGGVDDTKLIAPINPFPVAGGQTQTTTVFLVAPAGSFHAGEKTLVVRIDDGEGFARNFTWRMTGPEERP